MLPTPPKELTEAVLREACADGWPETQTLDFKWGLPGTTDEDRAEFAKDICAFANADGGDRVYGISDRNARANEIVPIQNLAPDTVRRRWFELA
jgi:predicted HTH transcriptional regulator